MPDIKTHGKLSLFLVLIGQEEEEENEKEVS